jgi:hypothetical protein
MKKFLVIMSLTLTTSTFADTVSVFRFDDVDVVIANGKTVSVEDLRDEFAKVKGVQVNEDIISVTSESKAIILFRNPAPNKLFGITTKAAKTGGDMGGG